MLISYQAIYLKTGKAVEICFGGETFICLPDLHPGTRIRILWEMFLHLFKSPKAWGFLRVLLYVCHFWINDISPALRKMSFCCHCLSRFPWIYHFHFQWTYQYQTYPIQLFIALFLLRMKAIQSKGGSWLLTGKRVVERQGIGNCNDGGCLYSEFFLWESAVSHKYPVAKRSRAA